MMKNIKKKDTQPENKLDDEFWYVYIKSQIIKKIHTRQSIVADVLDLTEGNLISGYGHYLDVLKAICEKEK